MRKTLLARSSPTRVTDEVSMIDLPTDGSLPDGAFNDDHLGTLDAVRGAVHPIRKQSDITRSRNHSARPAFVQVVGRRHHERRRLLRRPASKKRQGTKSRGVWPPLRAAGVM